MKLPYDPVCPSVGRSVCHDFLKRREVTLPCSYRSTFFSWEQRIHKNENTYNFFYQTVLSTISRLLSDFVTNSPKALGVETLTNETWRREGIRLKTRNSTRSLIIMINWNSNGEFMSELKKKGLIRVTERLKKYTLTTKITFS